MTTQTQGKGKKKNKEVMKLTLDEFNQIDAPHGHSVVSLKMTGLDWAATMADYDQKSTETQQIIVPTAPRAQRGPNVDYDQLPNEPPFRVSVFNLPMSMEEKEIADRFFQDIEVIRVEMSKTEATVELSTKDGMYEALCKDGTSIKGRTVNVVPFGQTPQNNYSDRYGGGSGRGGNSYGDRYGDRSQGGGFGGGARSGDRYVDRPGGFNRERDNYSGFSRGGGFGQPREAGGSGGERFQTRNNFRDNRGSYTSGGGEPESEEPTNWRARPAARPSPPSSYNGSRQPYTHSRSEPSHYQQAPPPMQHQYQPHQESYHQSRYQHHNHPQTNSPYNSQYNNQSNSRPLSTSSTEERPKLVLKPRKTPINLEDVPTRNEAIFGKAKPSSTPYEKMQEIEAKLKGVSIKTDKPAENPPESQ